MKLRLRGNTIRLRLLQAEVDRLGRGEAVRETLPTPMPFGYEVRPDAVDDLTAAFEGGTLSVSVPAGWAAAWPASDEVGRKANSGGIEILIEKDWACTTARDEDESGTYPNPSALR